ncbi:MAG: hypothetical protein EOO96_03375 [Pedobacter sp.]|jgi:hypothetical protein|nr:MAG: hypothetical protein EOO96_03375 [Pedobacter sp.]
MKKMLFIALASAMLISCSQNKEKGKVVTFEEYHALNQKEENNGKRFAIVGYPFVDGDITVKSTLSNDSQLPHIAFYDEPGGKGKMIASLPMANGKGKNEFDAPGTFTMDQVVFYDNEGKPLKYTDKMEVSFTMDLQVDRSKTTMNDKSVYYGGPSETRIDKAN